MSATGLTTTGSSRRQWLALLTYAILLIGLVAIAVASISNLLVVVCGVQGKPGGARASRSATATLRDAPGLIERGSPGPPFLSGKTITIAGAALQERVEAAVKKAGGNVLSSQIDLQGPHSAEGFIRLTESLEIDQASLQPLLYDLEAGMPYLFVENLAIQAPQAFGEAEGAPMRVLVVVSGLWREPQ